MIDGTTKGAVRLSHDVIDFVALLDVFSVPALELAQKELIRVRKQETGENAKFLQAAVDLINHKVYSR